MRTVIDTYTGTRSTIPMAIHVSDFRERGKERDWRRKKSEGWNKKADSKKLSGAKRGLVVKVTSIDSDVLQSLG
jgi:hypothetical protein